MSDQGVFSGVHEVTLTLPDSPEPSPGLVVKWRQRGQIWEGLVTREVDGKIITGWLPAVMLQPAASAEAPVET
jgi:hypothetical protein